ncbi:solute carrier family 46 member 2 isoform X2 [Lepisosteus oculatus]|uniref:solute carrier family 46 member 2 isoform X2 n=1 Tax=Lepisosteus oculatus TaxID=7918 RepID=UPI00371F37D9
MECAALFRTYIEPVVLAAQFGSALYDTGLQIVVKESYNRKTSINSTNPGDDLQKAISNFYMIYSMISSFVPFLPALFLARLGDKRCRKIPIGVPLVGYFLSRALLLLVVLVELPIEVMFGGAVLYGLCGGFSSYWAGVMALASSRSSEERRSLQLIRIELVYGIAGFVGSLCSGHILSFSQAVLVGASVFLYLLCIIYIAFVLKVTAQLGSLADRNKSEEEQSGPLESTGLCSLCAYGKTNIVLLFVSALLYDVSVGSAMEILISFVMKAPLDWGAKEVGYGNAAGFVIFITSFLGVWVFSRCLRDTTMIIIGMLSFASGIYVMSFVRKTYLFYIARALNLFALIPMPTIRSLLSKQVPGSSYGKIMIVLQLSFTLAGVAYSPIFTKIYQATLDWFAGFVFTLSSILTCLAIIPICIVGWRTTRQEGYERIPS